MSLSRLIDRVERHLDEDSGAVHERVPGLVLLRETAPTDLEAAIYEPIVCLILQGAKETTVGHTVFTVSEGECVVVSHDLPVLARITRASPRRPYLALVVRLDLAILRSLHDEIGGPLPTSDVACSMAVASVDAPTTAVVERYLDLLDDPVAARVLLFPLVRKELHYRLYVSHPGAMLRSLIRRDSHANHIARAIRTLRKSFRESVAIEDLARSVGMSTSAFHKHFKTVTLTSPLRYQKDLRLTEARRLLRVGTGTVTEVAFEVGYQSASQFSREYASKFGRPPRRDLASDRGAS